VGLVSQRPGKLDGDALSQCNTQCLLRIINPLDQNKVRESVEAVGQEIINELPALTKGQAIIAGAGVNTPLLCQVRTRYTPHGAPDIAAPQVWHRYLAGDGLELPPGASKMLPG
jgi:DNA helicase HerA-like ATPase